jgi:hypothetical protein
MISVLSMLRYDTPHAVLAARRIIAEKPKFVAVELPSSFQGAIDGFLAGKVSEEKFLAAAGKLFGRKVSVDKGLLKPGAKIPKATSDEAFGYIILAAKQVGAKVVAIDSSFSDLKPYIEQRIFATGKGRAAALARAERTLNSPDQGFLTFFEFVHAPFHFLELLLGHNPEAGPSKHPVGCRMCKAGVRWERFWSAFYSESANLLHPIGEAKYVSALRAFDCLREKKMVSRVIGLLKSKDDPTKVMVVIHLWHAGPVIAGLRWMRVKVAQIY